ncbi:MAG: A/G-specific adenine glycosylase [Sphingobacteriales bacterium]|nr:A/G-specific adenine glycosylase [Sphingobacteriales bacterium]
MKRFITKELYKNDKKTYFTTTLLKWDKETNQRKMPWKGEKDPYKIWLSEIILQQTRVEQGWAYYEKFLKTFPTVQKLSKAKDEKVFKMWEGLGYYSRCKNLLTTARTITNKYKGNFPTKYEEIVGLKGVGPYTAAAIASFAYNLPYAVLDGNVMRVLSRYFGINIAVDTSEGKKRFQEIANDCMAADKAGLYNQSIMDFGATVCKPLQPICQECPLQKNCVAFNNDTISQLPYKEKKISKKERWFYFLVIDFNNKVYVRKRIEKDVWQNLFEYVSIEISSPEDVTSFLKSSLYKRVMGKQKGELIVISRWYKQQLSHQTIHGRFLTIKVKNPILSLTDFLLLNKRSVKKIPFPRLINSWHEDGNKDNVLF